LVNQPLTRVLGIALEPRTGITQPETVAPAIHVGYQAITADTVEFIREHHLQVADRRFLEVVAAGIGLELLSPVAGHANNVAGFMQQRVHGGITTNMNGAADDAGFTISPEAPGNRLAVWLHLDAQAVSVEQGFDRCHGHISYSEHALQRRNLLEYRAYKITNDSLTHQVFFTSLSEHKRFIVGVVAGKCDVLWRHQACFAGDQRVLD